MAVGGSQRVLEPGTNVAGRYEIRAWLGTGPLGQSYRVLDRRRGAEVALKIFARELFDGDADRAAALAHLTSLAGRTLAGSALPGSVAQEREGLCAVTPLIEGTSLRSALDARVSAGRPLEPEEALRVLLGLASALSTLHAATPHGSLRPENVLLTATGVVLTDVGVALALPRARLLARIESWGVDAYVAPEVVAGRNITTTADLFAVGAIAAELLTNSPTVEAVQYATMSDEVRAALTSLMDRDRARRAGSLGALLDGLSQACGLPRRSDERPLPTPVLPPEKPLATPSRPAPAADMDPRLMRAAKKLDEERRAKNLPVASAPDDHHDHHDHHDEVELLDDE